MDDHQIVDLFLSRDQEAISQTAEKYGGRLRHMSPGPICLRFLPRSPAKLPWTSAKGQHIKAERISMRTEYGAGAVHSRTG